MVSSPCSAAAQSSSWVLAVVCFDLLPIRNKKPVLINEVHYFCQVLQVTCLIYIWIIINSKDQNSQASVTWKCSTKSLVILDRLGLLWTSKVRSTKVMSNKLKHVGTGPDVDAGGRCSGLLYKPASLLFSSIKEEVASLHWVWIWIFSPYVVL